MGLGRPNTELLLLLERRYVRVMCCSGTTTTATGRQYRNGKRKIELKFRYQRVARCRNSTDCLVYSGSILRNPRIRSRRGLSFSSTDTLVCDTAATPLRNACGHRFWDIFLLPFVKPQHTCMCLGDLPDRYPSISSSASTRVCGQHSVEPALAQHHHQREPF